MKNWRLLSSYLRSDWDKVTAADLLLICCDSDRPFEHNSLYYSPLLDTVGELATQLGARCISFSDRLSLRVGRGTYNRPLTMNRLLLVHYLAKKLALKLGFNSESVMKTLTEREALRWEKVLAKAQPRLVIGIQPNMPLCLACHRLGVPIFDLQHGLISDTPDNPYYFSGRRHVFHDGVLPSGVLCWDKESVATLKCISWFQNKELISVGNPWFGRFVDNSADDDLVQRERAKLACEKGDKPVVLVTLQHNMRDFAGDYVTDGVMVDALREVIKNTSERYLWLIRLHPSQMAGSEKTHLIRYLECHFGGSANVLWQSSSRSPMPLVLAMADLHITHFSSTVVEAANFGVHSALLDPHICPGGKHETFYRHEIDNGFAEVVEARVEAIEDFIAKRLAHLDKQSKSYYSCEPIKQFLQKKLRDC